MLLKAIFIAVAAFMGIATAISSKENLDALHIASMVGSDGTIRLTDRTFDKVVQGPRDYTIAVLLTAEGAQYSCGFCKIVAPAWRKLASSWVADHPQGDGLFFAVADISDTPTSFGKLGLNQAPNLWIYPPTEKDQPIEIGYDVYKFGATQDQVSPLIDYFARTYGKNIVIHEPFPYDKVFISVTTVLALAFGIYAYWDTVVSALQYKPLWAAFSLLFILMFTAGYMFNTIRRPPYIAGDGNGGVVYFAAGHGNQLAIETQIIAIVYAIMSFASICLVVKVPKLKSQPSVLALVCTLTLATFVTYSFLLSKFKIKSGGYPYGLLDIF